MVCIWSLSLQIIEDKLSTYMAVTYAFLNFTGASFTNTIWVNPVHEK